MSSYLNFYLVPKKKENNIEPKPLLFNSYSRNSEVYQAFWEVLNPAYIGLGDTPNYSELTAEDVNKVLKDLEKDLKSAEKRLNLTIEAYKVLSGGSIPEEAINEYTSTKEYIEDIQETISIVKNIHSWVEDIKYSDFEKVLINID